MAEAISAFWTQYGDLLLVGLRDTLVMTFVSTFFAYVIGLPLGVLVNIDRTILAAGGFVVQLMPGADEELIGKLEENIFMMDQLTTVLNEDGAEALFKQVLKGFDWHTVGEYPVEYRCYCSRERVEQALTVIDPSELQEIIDDGKDISVSCQFCDREYSFSPADLILLKASQAKTDAV